MSAADAAAAADTREELQQQIRAVLARVLRVRAEEIGDETSPETVRSWDSISHFRLVSALEERFGLRFELREIQTLDSFAAIARVLASRLRQMTGAGHRP